MHIENRYMFNSKGDNFIMTILKPHLQEPDALIKDIYYCHESTGQTAKQNLLLCMPNTNLLSDLLKTGLAGITRISAENWWQCFLHITLRCLADHKNGTFTDILKCILWDFDKKSGYFLFLLSIIVKSHKKQAVFTNLYYSEEKITGRKKYQKKIHNGSFYVKFKYQFVSFECIHCIWI